MHAKTKQAELFGRRVAVVVALLVCGSVCEAEVTGDLGIDPTEIEWVWSDSNEDYEALTYASVNGTDEEYILIDFYKFLGDCDYVSWNGAPCEPTSTALFSDKMDTGWRGVCFFSDHNDQTVVYIRVWWDDEHDGDKDGQLDSGAVEIN